MKSQHPLICPYCNHYRYIEYQGVRFEEEGKSFGIKIPFYICKNCEQRESILPRERFEKFKQHMMPDIHKGEFFEFSLKFVFSKLDHETKYERFEHLGFTYDPRDHYLIPGLYREFDIGYLTPVFFDKDVLLYYNNHPDFTVRLGSFSSGNIYFKGKPLFNWGFGITRSGKIFKWLGDLANDFESEDMKPHLKRFQASNVPSDHDIVSKFYFSQIPYSVEDAFQDSDNENQVIRLKNKFDERVITETGLTISKLDIDKLEDYYKHPILNERTQIFNSYLSLTKLLIENVQVDQLKAFLLKSGLTENDLKGLKSLKLMELFFKVHFKREDFKELMTPLYVLYDLRLLHGHLTDTSFQDKYNSCKERLKLPTGTDDFEVYKVLVKKLIDLYSQFVNSEE